ncbi:hypothetical protein TNCV_162221 [Trichonephila clavipes]|nr:hypothetical protein TNCV_162221 [Trichonephila clavipes]
MPESGTLPCPRNTKLVKDQVTLLAEERFRASRHDGHLLQMQDGNHRCASLMATMMIGFKSSADDSTNVVGSKADVLKAAVSAISPQPSAAKWWMVPRGVMKRLQNVEYLTIIPFE